MTEDVWNQKDGEAESVFAKFRLEDGNTLTARVAGCWWGLVLKARGGTRETSQIAPMVRHPTAQAKKRKKDKATQARTGKVVAAAAMGCSGAASSALPDGADGDEENEAATIARLGFLTGGRWV